ncbi:MAG: class I SAM-dependent methyltransferase [Deltaproteobacteria bacterium]|nr:class I SAM-dependent methyltransferase [Deltaproteobacteria bacterium]
MAHLVCPWWLCHSFDNPLRRLFHDPEGLLAPHVKAGMQVLDIGCGMGYFTLAMARLAGSDGRVVAVDLQERMLAALGKRARKAGVDGRIVLHRCRPDTLGLNPEAETDFALAFWMAHEVPDQPRLFREIRGLLKPGGRFLLVEPKLHVTLGTFEGMAAACLEAGFRILERPAVSLSRAVLLEKG